MMSFLYFWFGAGIISAIVVTSIILLVLSLPGKNSKDDYLYALLMVFIAFLCGPIYLMSIIVNLLGGGKQEK